MGKMDKESKTNKEKSDVENKEADVRKEKPKVKNKEPIKPMVNGKFMLTKAMLKNKERLQELLPAEKEKMRKEFLKKFKPRTVMLELPTFLVEDYKKHKKNELIVITNAKKLLRYVVQVTEKAPKKFRFTFVNRIQNYAIDILEHLFRANQLRTDIKTSLEERKKHQKDAYTELKLLSYMAYMAYENKCILEKHYIQIATRVRGCLDWLIEWIAIGKKTG